ncbi:MAG: UDP-N-acetylmuramate dehydrogenase [Spirochaetaceae bacterium]|nr:UDP-N-acetylmuramate dehydrogenase [Spirochaetaceae bacterium]
MYYNVRKITENFNMQGNFQGQILQDESMAERTTFKIGGKADLLLEPMDIPSLKLAILELNNAGIPFVIVGGGSNIVVPDQGLRYAVISTRALCSISHQEVEGETYLSCQCGCTIQQITEYCQKHNLGGLENFAGLPGTVGGALYMNARCYDKSFNQIVKSINFLEEKTGSEGTYFYDSADWDYKKSPFQTSLASSVIIEADFFVKPLVGKTDIQDSLDKASGFIQDRKQKGHFDYPSAGSVFKNNREFGKPSGQIIDQLGLKGMTLGGAKVAPWHGNFIINTGNALAKDVKALVERIQAEVKSKTGFVLEPEIIFLSDTKTL